MKELRSIAVAVLLAGFSMAGAQVTAEEKGLNAINNDVIQAQLGFLASDWMEGRKAGDRGELISSDYIASMLRLYGVKPYGDRVQGGFFSGNTGNRSWFQTFTLLKTTQTEDPILELIVSEGGSEKITAFTNNLDFSFRPLSTISVNAPVIFAGYGFKNTKVNFDELSKLDLRGKLVMRLAGVPSFANSKLTRDEINNSLLELEKLARGAGAAGIIDIYPLATLPYRTAENPAERGPRPDYSRLTVPSTGPSNDFVRLTVSMRAANEILRGSGISIEEYRKKADAGQPGLTKPVAGRTLRISGKIETVPVSVRNVLGIIEGKRTDEFIVLGAHYDHMGMNDGYIWNGADDNGSGTAGIMTVAKAIMETGVKPEKSIIVALWTAEEAGLIGSEYFVDNLPFPRENIRLNLNFDMISRYISDDQPDKVVMTYTASKASFRELTADHLRKYNIRLDVEYQPSDDPPGGSDHRTFVAAGIPVMRFKPGHREEYHTPYDEVSTIDWDIMEKIIKISFLNIWKLANNDF